MGFDDDVRQLADLPVFFIGGLPRSGTTWLQKLLNAHPAVLCMGESHFINDLVPKLAGTVGEYSERRAQGVATWAPTVRGPDTAQMLPILRTAFASLSAANLDGKLAEGLVAVGEKTPDNLIHLARLWTVFPQAMFINIIRDPRDGAVSGFARFRSRLPADLDLGAYVAAYSKDWSDRIRNARRLAEERGAGYAEVLYEDLHRQPEPEATRLFRFIGASDDAEIVRAAVDEASFERLSGGRKRGDEDPASHYRRGEVGGWREVLEADTVAAVARSAGPLMEDLGYA